MRCKFLVWQICLLIYIGACKHRFTQDTQAQNFSSTEVVIDLFQELDAQNLEPLASLKSVYEDRVLNLENKTVKVTPIRTFALGRKIGTGTSTVVYAVADETNTVLRLAKSLGHSQLKLNQYMRNAKVLAKYQVPHAEVVSFEPSRFVQVQRVGMHDVSFEDAWIKPREFFSERNLPEPESLKSFFLKFAAQTAVFTEMSDFNWKQVLFDEESNQWTLVDWDEEFFAEKSGHKLSLLGAEQSIAKEIETDLQFALKQGKLTSENAGAIEVFAMKLEACVIAMRKKLARLDELDEEERSAELKGESLPEACRSSMTSME